MWVDPIFNRANSDVVNKTAKGRIGAVDINRVEGNCQHLADRNSISITTKTWTRNNFPNVSDFTRIRSNVSTLRSKMQIYSTTPGMPGDLRNWSQWNSLERILYDLYIKYGELVNSQNYTGEAYAGDQIGVM